MKIWRKGVLKGDLKNPVMFIEYNPTTNKKKAEAKYVMIKKKGYHPELWRSGDGWIVSGFKDKKKR